MQKLFLTICFILSLFAIGQSRADVVSLAGDSVDAAEKDLAAGLGVAPVRVSA